MIEYRVLNRYWIIYAEDGLGTLSANVLNIDGDLIL